MNLNGVFTVDRILKDDSGREYRILWIGDYGVIKSMPGSAFNAEAKRVEKELKNRLADILKDYMSVIYAEHQTGKFTVGVKIGILMDME